MNRNSTGIWIMVIAATFFWGSNFNAGRELARVLPPLTAASWRFGIAVFVLLMMRALRAGAESVLSRADMLKLCALGLIGVFGFNYAFFTALHTTSALNAALIMALSPLLTTLLTTRLLGTAIHARQLLGIAVAFIGVALVITGGHLAVLHIAVGDIWMLFACFAWSLYSVLVQKFAAHVPPLQQARWTITAGATALIALAIVLEPDMREPIALLTTQSLSTGVIVLYMALCGTVLAYIFWLRGVQNLGPQRAVIAFNLVPVFTLSVNLLFGQIPKVEQIIGLFTVIVGVLIASGWRPKRAAPVALPPTLPPRKKIHI